MHALVLDYRREESGEPATLSLALGQGARYCLVVRSQEQKDSLLEQLDALAGARSISSGGGLIGNLRVWENLVLPAWYHGQKDLGRLEAWLLELFDRCGVDGKAAFELAGKLPDEMTLYERRLAGFVRAMADEPELMVFDGVFDGLGKDEAEKVARFEEIFHLYFPFRTSFQLVFDEKQLPSCDKRTAFYL